VNIMGNLMSLNRRRGVVSVALMTLVAMLVIAVVGSPESKSASSVDAQLKIANANLKPYLGHPSPERPIEKLKKLPKGKSVAVLNCGIPSCNVVWDQIQQPAKQIGMKVFQVKAGNDPQTLSTALDSALARNPSGVLSVSQPKTIFPKAALATMKSKGIPLIGVAVPEIPGPKDNPAVIYNTATVKTESKLMADYAFTKAKGNTKAAFFWPTELSLFSTMAKGFVAEMKARCPSCSAANVPVSISTIGTTLPSRVVSYLQQNPKVNWLGFAFGDLTSGVPQALKAAGINNVKIVTQGGAGAVLADIRAGRIDSSINVDSYYQAYQEVDAFARAFAGQKQPPQYVNSGITQPAQFFTKDTTTAADAKRGGLLAYPNTYKKTFLKAWGLSK